MSGDTRMHVPAFLELPLTAVIYALCAAILGASLFPSAYLALRVFRRLLLGELLVGLPPTVANVAVFSLMLGACFFLFLFCALLLMGLCVRALSFAVIPGTHPALSRTTFFWMTLNSIHTMAFRLILPIVPGGFLSNGYFRLAGCGIGKDVRLTTAQLLDPYLIDIGDGTVVGGDAIITAHIFQNGQLILAPIHIGKDCQIGAHALICPGVTIGDGASVGIRTYVRRGTRIAAGAHVEAVGGLPAREVVAMEKGRRTVRRADAQEGAVSPAAPSPPRRNRR